MFSVNRINYLLLYYKITLDFEKEIYLEQMQWMKVLKLNIETTGAIHLFQQMKILLHVMKYIYGSGKAHGDIGNIDFDG